MSIAVGRSVVNFCADRLCRLAALALRRASMRAIDLRDGDGCLRPRRLGDVVAGLRHPSMSWRWSQPSLAASRSSRPRPSTPLWTCNP